MATHTPGPEPLTFGPCGGMERWGKTCDCVPSRAAGSHAEEAYYQSRYRPQDATDTPFHHKGEGDRLYRHRQWRGAADAYSQVAASQLQ